MLELYREADLPRRFSFAPKGNGHRQGRNLSVVTRRRAFHQIVDRPRSGVELSLPTSCHGHSQRRTRKELRLVERVKPSASHS